MAAASIRTGRWVENSWGGGTECVFYHTQNRRKAVNESMAKVAGVDWGDAESQCLCTQLFLSRLVYGRPGYSFLSVVLT